MKAALVLFWSVLFAICLLATILAWVLGPMFLGRAVAGVLGLCFARIGWECGVCASDEWHDR